MELICYSVCRSEERGSGEMSNLTKNASLSKSDVMEKLKGTVQVQEASGSVNEEGAVALMWRIMSLES